MKLCLLEFYTRLSVGLRLFQRATVILRITLALSFVAIVMSTVLECRPISLYWNGMPAGDHCRQARANYITVGTFDLGTDLALIIFPIPIVWKASMYLKKRLRLGAVFSAGSLVVIVTLIRIPLTLRGTVPQKTRSLWADIEIACACLVTNVVPFYYPLARDILTGHVVTNGSDSAGQSRGSQAVQWEVARQPSYPSRNAADDELKLFTVTVRASDGRKGPTEESEVRRFSVVRMGDAS